MSCIGLTQGVQGWQMPQQYFVCLEICFWAANKKYRYFQNDYLGSVETENLKKTCVLWDAD
jgi:hypothetical protein